MNVGTTRSAQDWVRTFTDPDGKVPPFGRHRRAGEMCQYCHGFWPCEPAKEADRMARRIRGRA